MLDSKPWWQSRAVVSGLVSAGLSVAGMVGVNLGGAGVEDVTNAVLQLGSAAAAAYAVYGRVIATTTIRGR